MKQNKTADRIERALWHAGRLPEPFTGGPVITGGQDWHDGVMAAIRRIGPLAAPSPGEVHGRATAWSWAAAAAACLAIGIAGYAFNELNADTVLAGLFLDDPAGWTVNMMLAAM